MSPELETASYPGQASERDRWILERRPARAAIDVQRPSAFLIEQEPTANGGMAEVTTIFLTGRECPWRCLMCDLWKHTTEERTPAGALPAQIDFALTGLRMNRRNDDERSRLLKLYNSGSFFDRAAVPIEDYEPIARRAAGFERIIVESHPALIGDLTLRFRDLLAEMATTGIGHLLSPSHSSVPNGGVGVQRLGEEPHATAIHPAPQLEVAMGLETAHPEVLEKLNKRVTLEQFAAAAAFLKREGIALRVFVLVKPPFMDEHEALEWAERSTQFAFDCGAEVVSLIPTRFGNGALEALAPRGQFALPRLSTLEAALERGLGVRRGRVFADVWDLEKFSNCPACLAARRERLELMNLRQTRLPPIRCERCS